MPIKLIMTWDIIAEREREYFEFVIGEFIPGVQRMGLQPVEAWVTTYGDYPQIQVGILADNLSGLQRVLQSDGWTQLRDRLSGFVENLSFKITHARGGFQF
jgi:hypothetical protein